MQCDISVGCTHPRLTPASGHARGEVVGQAFQHLASELAGDGTALASRLIEGVALYPEETLLEEPDLIIAAMLGAGRGALAADLDLAAGRIDLEDLERLHQVGHAAGQPLAPVSERLRGP